MRVSAAARVSRVLHPGVTTMRHTPGADGGRCHLVMARHLACVAPGACHECIVGPSAAGEPVAWDRLSPGSCRCPALASVSLEPMTREAFLFRLRLMGRTMLAAFAASVLFGATLGAGFSWYNVYASIGTGALIGLPIFAFEAFFVSSPLGAGFRRWPLSRFVAARCSVWLAWIFSRDAPRPPLVLEHRRSAVGGCRYVVDHRVFLHRLTFGRLGPGPEPPNRTRRIPPPAAWALSLAHRRAVRPPVHRPGRLHRHRRAAAASIWERFTVSLWSNFSKCYQRREVALDPPV